MAQDLLREGGVVQIRWRYEVVEVRSGGGMSWWRYEVVKV